MVERKRKMYEVQDIQDYEQKWLKAERDLAINWVEWPYPFPDVPPQKNIDEGDRDWSDRKKRGGT